jgi:hypothetical protein
MTTATGGALVSFFFEQGPVPKDGELPIYSTGGHTTYRKGHQEKRK